MKFNILKESFITNSPISNQYLFNAEEISNLISITGNSISITGNNINLFIDLGLQRSIEEISYLHSPITVEGLNIYYGREINNLTSGNININTSGVSVYPTQSGFNYPRYIQLTHTITGSVLVSGILALNTDTEIDYSTTTDTIQSSGIAGYSQVYEIKVINSGSILTDIYFSVDTDLTDKELIPNIEISNLPTSGFISYSSDISIPNSVPWEYGEFTNSAIHKNTLVLNDPYYTIETLPVGSIGNLNSVPSNQYANPKNLVETRLSSGHTAFIVSHYNNRLQFIDPIRNIRVTSSAPAVSPTIDDERGQFFAWDLQDRVYYINNSTDQVIRYYKISTDTHHILATSTFYSRKSRLLYYADGYLYIGGARTTAGNSNSMGSIFYKINTDTLQITQLSSLPFTPSDWSGVSSQTYSLDPRPLGGYFYLLNNLDYSFYRYNIQFNTWEDLGQAPTGSNSISICSTENSIYIGTTSTGVNHCKYSILTNTYITNILPILFSNAGQVKGILIMNSDSYFIESNSFTTSMGLMYRILRDYIADNLTSTTISGNWVSPIFLFDKQKYSKLLIDYYNQINTSLKINSSLGVDNFEIRGSNQYPCMTNFIEKFEEPLDNQIYFKSTLNGYTSIVSSGQELTFSHTYIDDNTTQYNASSLYYGYPFSSNGKMQYKFWWSPATNKLTDTALLSKICLVPYIDSIGLGTTPDRDITTFERLRDDYVYIEFGNSGDYGGKISSISLYNGNNKTTYGISARSGNYYEVKLILDWGTGAYQLFFASKLIGSGTVPQSRLNYLRPEHSFELFSGNKGINSEEKYKYISINRNQQLLNLGDNKYFTVNYNDPIYGVNSNLPWFPITVNSPLIPNYDFIQFRLGFRSTNTTRSTTINSVKFPAVLRLENIAPGEYKSVYIRYNFPLYNNLTTKPIYFKSWMFTDKE